MGGKFFLGIYQHKSPSLRLSPCQSNSILPSHPQHPTDLYLGKVTGVLALGTSPKPEATKVNPMGSRVGSCAVDGSFCILAPEAHIPAKSMPDPRTLSLVGPQEILIEGEDQRVKFTRAGLWVLVLPQFIVLSLNHPQASCWDAGPTDFSALWVLSYSREQRGSLITALALRTWGAAAGEACGGQD